MTDPTRRPNRLWSLLRDWHIWVGIAAAVPMLILGVSTIFMTHKNALDFRLPPAMAAMDPKHAEERQKCEERFLRTQPGAAEAAVAACADVKHIREDGKTYGFEKFMKDLHTGKFLGKLKWLWGDILGAAMVLFTLSGLVTWWRAKKRAADQVQRASH